MAGAGEIPETDEISRRDLRLGACGDFLPPDEGRRGVRDEIPVGGRVRIKAYHSAAARVFVARIDEDVVGGVWDSGELDGGARSGGNLRLDHAVEQPLVALADVESGTRIVVGPARREGGRLPAVVAEIGAGSGGYDAVARPVGQGSRGVPIRQPEESGRFPGRENCGDLLLANKLQADGTREIEGL